jgi:hypothetical protein
MLDIQTLTARSDDIGRDGANVVRHRVNPDPYANY